MELVGGTPLALRHDPTRVWPLMELVRGPQWPLLHCFGRWNPSCSELCLIKKKKKQQH